MIVEYIYLDKTLGELSRVSKQFKVLCAPYMLQNSRIYFSRVGLECLEQEPKSLPPPEE